MDRFTAADVRRIRDEALASRPRAHPPKDGTFLILSPAMINDLDLVAYLAWCFPHATLIAQQRIPVR